MMDWRRFASEWESAIRSRFRGIDLVVNNFGNEIRVTLFKANFPSASKYFPFGKFYSELEERLSPEMFYFWSQVEKIRTSLSPKPDFRKPELVPNFSKNYSWRYSIGSSSHPYIDLSEKRKEISKQGEGEQLKKDAEYLDQKDSNKTSSLQLLAAQNLRLLAKSLLAASPEKIKKGPEMDGKLQEAKDSGEKVILRYTRKDGLSYDMTVVVKDFFKIKGQDFVWVEKDGIPGNYRSLIKSMIG